MRAEGEVSGVECEVKNDEGGRRAGAEGARGSPKEACTFNETAVEWYQSLQPTGFNVSRLSGFAAQAACSLVEIP